MKTPPYKISVSLDATDTLDLKHTLSGDYLVIGKFVSFIDDTECLTIQCKDTNEIFIIPKNYKL
jgi:hypothetical protein